jgi:MOSC domain-containing protein YiiM
VQRDPRGSDLTTNALGSIKAVRGVGVSEFGRGLNLGVYGEVLLAGDVRVGDPVQVQPAPGVAQSRSDGGQPR